MIKGYKAFHKDMKNRYGMEFVEGKSYSVDGEISFGNKGNGFHFCKRLEDTLRYVPAMEEEIEIAEITGFGDIVERVDEYYGYYDLYAARNIRIDKILTRDEIIAMFLNEESERVIRFISGYRLNPEEIELFKIMYSDDKRVLKALSYYQENKKDVYNIKQKVKDK